MYKELITIKGTRNGLVFYFNTNEASFEELRETLEGKFQNSHGFFDHATFIINPDNSLNNDEIKIMEDICLKHGLVKNSGKKILAPGASKPVQVAPIDMTEYLKTECDAVLITKNIRSGQKISVTGHAVVLGDVNPGAQLVATGSIIVMGYFRGLAHAGSHGDESSFILAYRLQPTQLGIAGKLRRSPEHLIVADCPEKAQIVDDNIIIEPYQFFRKRAVNL
jgi:septum site-determining protein MinC